MRLLCLVLLLASVPVAFTQTLAEKMGFKPDERILIINGDDVGMCHAANEATIECLEQGVMTSATIMVPCPWFMEIANYAAKDAPNKDFGIHLAHTSEWRVYRWGPVASKEQVPGLIDPEGYMHRAVPQVYLKAKPREALIEGRAQIDKALAAGVDITHLDSHMGTLQVSPLFLEVYIQLGLEYNLPLRMGSQESFVKFGFPKLREKIAATGLVFPDHFIHEELERENKMGVKPFWMDIVKNLKPGVTELYIHAAKAGDELKNITGSWKTRDEEYQLFAKDPEFRKLLEDLKIKRIGFRPLRDLQRKQFPSGFEKKEFKIISQ